MVTDPAAISVSKINQWVSLYVLIIWGILIVVATPFSDLITPTLLRHPFYGYFSAIIANAFFIWKMWCGSKNKPRQSWARFTQEQDAPIESIKRVSHRNQD